MALHLALDHCQINLFNRLSAGELLEQWEVEEIMRQAQSPVEELATSLVTRSKTLSINIIDISSLRDEKTSSGKSLKRQSLSVRLVYIRGYLNWLADLWIGRLRRAGKLELARQLKEAQERVSIQFGTRIPRRRKRATLKQREGLSAIQKARLMEVIDPASPENPWTSKHARIRNELIIKLLDKLGCRRGELLGLRIQDINFATGLTKIVRKADDKSDPRRYQPQTKTNDREIALGEELTLLVKQYVQTHRRAIKGARKHGFLIVANGSGEPLSLDGLTKVFAKLRTRCPDLPDDFSPHVLRHTWNEEFSEHSDRKGISDAEEAKIRDYAMGWVTDSDTSQVYLRRRTREQSHKASLKMQEDLVRKRAK